VASRRYPCPGGESRSLLPLLGRLTLGNRDDLVEGVLKTILVTIGFRNCAARVRVVVWRRSSHSVETVGAGARQAITRRRKWRWKLWRAGRYLPAGGDERGHAGQVDGQPDPAQVHAQPGLVVAGVAGGDHPAVQGGPQPRDPGCWLVGQAPAGSCRARQLPSGSQERFRHRAGSFHRRVRGYRSSTTSPSTWVASRVRDHAAPAWAPNLGMSAKTARSCSAESQRHTSVQVPSSSRVSRVSARPGRRQSAWPAGRSTHRGRPGQRCSGGSC
jgi:hypothetical protein